MKDQTLLKISLTGGLIGLAALFLITSTISIEESNISKLDETEESQIRIKGTVKSVRNSEKATFLEISKVETITAVVFDHVDLEEGSKVEIIGELGEYKGEKEILVDKIIKE